MDHAPSPLAVVEAEFVRLAPTHLTLRGHDVHPWLGQRTYTLHELRDVLMRAGTPYGVRDGVWRHTIRAARHCADWMVGALGLCMPALRGAAGRACRGLDAGGVDQVESAILATTIGQIRTINLDYARLAWYLSRRAHRAAMSARKHELGAPIPAGGARGEKDPDEGAQASPELLLVAAVRLGVLSAGEARLIATTRLEAVPLARAAQELGVSYKAGAKRRERAEARLVAAVRSGEVAVTDAFAGHGTANPAAAVLELKTSPASMSHRALRTAS